MRRVSRPAQLPDGARLLHIGLPKTGTSALQAALDLARDELAERGVEHVTQTSNPMGLARHLTGRSRQAGHASTYERRWKRIADEFRHSPARHVVMSSEGFCAASPEQVEEIAEALGPDTHILITLRSVPQLLSSLWQQRVRVGSGEAFPDWLDRALASNLDEDDNPLRRIDPEYLLNTWGRQFGTDQMIFVCPDPRDRRANLRAVEDLLGVEDQLVMPPVQNASSPLAEVEMFRHVDLVRADEEHADTWRRAMRHTARAMADAPPAGVGQARVVVPRWVAERANHQVARARAAIADSDALVVGDLAHLEGDLENYPLEVEIPDQVSVASAGWYAGALARSAVAEFGEVAQQRIEQLERRVQRLTDRQADVATVAAASTGELASALWHRLRSRGRR